LCQSGIDSSQQSTTISALNCSSQGASKGANMFKNIVAG
jgi:hypothetical protein